MGTFHGPDGLSRSPRQPNDPVEEEDDFDLDDWVDNLHGFLHVMQPLPRKKIVGLAGAQILSVEEENSMVANEEISYSEVPREKKAEEEDSRLELVEK